MDTLVKDGDFFLDIRGIPVAIFGADEVIQRVLMALSVKKGYFLPDKEFGSLLYTLKSNISHSELSQRAFQYATIAISGIKEAELISADAKFSSPDTLLITLAVKINDRDYKIKIQTVK